MEIKTKGILKQLNGNIVVADVAKPNEGLTVGVAIATVLTAGNPPGTIEPKTSFHPVKKWELAQMFYNDEMVKLDKSDYKDLKAIIETSKAYIDLVIGQLLTLLADQEGKKSPEVAKGKK